MSCFEKLEAEVRPERLQEWTRRFSTGEFERRMARELKARESAEGSAV
jgi:hypothetical protein